MGFLFGLVGLEFVMNKLLNIIQADILHCNHDCDVVFMMCHKHTSGQTITFYDTEGGVPFIGDKRHITASDGAVVLINGSITFSKVYCR